MNEYEDDPNMLAPGVMIGPDALRLQFSRSGGPGGQNVNKVNTKAELWLALDQIAGLTDAARSRLIALGGRRVTAARELHLVCETERSAAANQRELFARLREMIRQAMIEPARRRKRKRSRASHRKRLENKKRRSDVKSNRRSIL